MVESFDLAWLSVTYSCNSKCQWCYASSNIYEKIKGKALAKERIPGIVDLISSLKIPRVILIGGEPTVYPYLEDTIRALSDRGILPNLVTNGRKFKDTEFTKRLYDAGLRSAGFSMEGSCAKTHDATTQVRGSFDEAVQGIKNCQEQGISVGTNTLISKLSSTPGELVNTLDKLYDLGIRSMNFNVCGVCVTDDKNNENLLDLSEAIKIFEGVYKHSKEKEGLYIRLTTPMPRCNFDPALLPELIQKNNKRIAGARCHVLTGKSFIIDYNGDIVPCTHLTGFPMLNIFEGDKIISKERFIDQYNSPVNAAFRERASHYPSKKCNNCTENCSGGCPLYWIKFDPDKQIRGINTPK